MKTLENNAKIARSKLNEYRSMGRPVIVENNLVIKANKNPKSKKLAVDAMCFQCHGGTETEMPDAGWRDQIRTCTSPKCAMYRHRPYR